MPTTNEVVLTILARRSIRSGYDRDRPVARELLETVVRCGHAAPSSKNARPWRFHVVTTVAVLDRMASTMETALGIESYVPHDPRTGAPHAYWQSTVLESAGVLRQAPAAIVIENRGVFSGGRAGLTAASPDALAGALASYAFECVGIGTALENMWVGAIALGLSASFMGDIAVAETAIADLLGLEGDLIGALALGYSDASALPALPSAPETQVENPVVHH